MFKTNVSDRIKMLSESEANARARADELSTMMEAVPAIIFVAHDRQCTRISTSLATQKLFRMPTGKSISKSAPEDVRPEHFRIMKDGREIPTADLPLQMAARTGREIRDVEVSIVFDDGAQRDIFGHAVPLFDEAGAVSGAIGAFADITEKNGLRRPFAPVKSVFNLLFRPLRTASGIGIPTPINSSGPSASPACWATSLAR